jgi:4-hydroxy-tetrahydrodipicolinate reductase
MPISTLKSLKCITAHKMDAPSGTALICWAKRPPRGAGINLDDHADRVRDGITGARKRGDIGFAVLRGG